MKSFGVRVYKEYFNFAAAHFLIFDDGTREELHGHNYRAQVAIEGVMGVENDSEKDVFIDFLHIKPIVKGVCDAIDHRTLLPQFNRFLKVEATETSVTAKYHLGDLWQFPRKDVLILPITNTSSERMAEFLCRQTLIQLEQAYPSIKISTIEFSVEESKGQCAVFKLCYPQAQPISQLLAEWDDQPLPIPAKIV